MTAALIIGGAWTLAGFALAVVIGKGIRLADDAMVKCPDVDPAWVLNEAAQR